MERPEQRNPLQSASVIGDRVSVATYRKQTLKRGELGYTMSRSELMEFMWNPRRWKNGFERKDTDDMAWGSLVDCLALTPDLFKTLYAVAPATYPSTGRGKSAPTEHKEWNRRAAYCQDWEAAQELEGRTVITEKEFNTARKAARILLEDHEVAQLVIASKSQVLLTASYHDDDNGVIVPLKMLLDLVPDKQHPEYGGKLADLKTSVSAQPHMWTKTVFNHHLHVQAALYLDAYNLATGEVRDTFLHIIQENYAPYDVSRRFLSQEFIAAGRATYTAALALYARCVATQTWPGYAHTGINWLGWQITEPEPWMING